MYIITNKSNNIVINFGKQVVYNGMSGFPAIFGTNTFYPSSQINLYSVKSIPENLTPFEWTFDGQNFSEIVFEESSENEEIEIEILPNDDTVVTEYEEVEFGENIGDFSGEEE